MGGPQERQPPKDAADATVLVKRVQDGDEAAANELLPLVYEELRARASSYFLHQPANHTLQPTALVHDVFVKLVRSPDNAWQNRAHFCAVASRAMRQVLTDHARRRAKAKHGNRQGVTQLETPATRSVVDVLGLDDALRQLADLNERHARLIELRFFGGLNNSEVAEVLGVSTSTIEKEWRTARAWLAHQLEGRSA
ncbi:MAG: ECF-type sigma factor [Planctomycetota bacterium]